MTSSFVDVADTNSMNDLMRNVAKLVALFPLVLFHFVPGSASLVEAFV
jgi:hypothetical protein